MVYQALARKWRPKKFADLVGQEHVVRALQNALQQGRLHHAYLLTGTRGVGKTTIARILAKSLNCEQGVGGEPCGVCSACVQIDSGRFVDLLEIDAASNTGIDNIREVLENAQYAPSVGRYKVYIIDEVHMLSNSAFNAMLKTLEEPPEHVKFILATTDPHKVPVTVLSRCLQFVLRNMTTQQIAGHLSHILDQEQVTYQQPALAIIAQAANGSMRDALSLLDQAIAMGSGKVAEQDVRQMLGAVDKRYLFGLLENIIKQDGQALIEQAAHIGKQSVGFEHVLGEMASLLQQLALIQAVPASLSEEDADKDSLRILAQNLSAEEIQLYYQCVLLGRQDLSLLPDEYAGFVMTLLRMLSFAPLAAKPDQLNWTVSGTQLHNPVTSVAKLQPLEVLTPVAAPVISEPVVQEAEAQEIVTEVPVEIPPQVESIIVGENTVVLPMEETEPEAMPWEPDEPVEHITEESFPTEEEIAEIFPVEDAYTSDVKTTIASEPVMASLQTEEVIDIPLLDPVEIPSVQSDGENEPDVEIVQADKPLIEESEELEQEEPLPEFCAQNWPEIVARLSTAFGTARMLAQNAVLLRIEGHKIYLALSEWAVDHEEMVNKMTRVLSECYHTKWQIITEALTGSGQTPNMLDDQKRAQKKAQAKEELAQDSVANQLLDLFEGQWLEETIQLKE